MERIMLRIGCHLSASNGFLDMAKQAVQIQANTFQYFTRNPRGSRVKDFDLKDIQSFLAFAEQNDIQKILGHASYTMNACAADEAKRIYVVDTMKEDLERLEYIPGALYNFHPGSHVNQGIDIGIEKIVQTLNEVLWEEQKTTVLLETMAGKGSEVGSRFQELKMIMDNVEQKDKLGICMDTCHIYDAGYDIVGNLEHVIDEFDQVIGLNKLYAIHLNDSMNPFNSHKDRHQRIGEGSIGFEAIEAIINYPALRELPFYLETPNELDGYQREIAWLKEHYRD